MNIKVAAFTVSEKFINTYLNTITISTYMWWLHNAEIRPHLHCLVYILYRPYTPGGPADVVWVVRLRRQWILTSEHCEGDITLQDVKVPGDNTTSLRYLY